MGVNRGEQRPGPFSVNDANPKNSPFQALPEIVLEKLRHFIRTKCVQIEFSSDGNRDGIDLIVVGLHAEILARKDAGANQITRHV